MDLDGQGGVPLINGYKQKGTEDGLENSVYSVLHGHTAVDQSASQLQSVRRVLQSVYLSHPPGRI